MSAEKFTPADPDGPCQKCGSWALDTGWECGDCGFDNIGFFYPEGAKKFLKDDSTTLTVPVAPEAK